MSNLSEREIIELFIDKFGKVYSPGKYLGLHDDAGEVVDDLLFNIDGYSSFNSKYPWENWEDWAWKTVVGSITDLIAKGAVPLALGFSVGLPKNEELPIIVDELARGLREACERYNLRVIKADTNRSLGDVWLNIATIGKLKITVPIPRSGLENENYVYTTLINGFGRLSAIYKSYLIGKINFEKARELYRRPEAPIKFLELLEKITVNSSMDLSDGLAYSLGTIARESGLSILLEDIPKPNNELEFLFNEEIEAEKEVLYGGEEYEIVFASRNDPSTVLSICENIGIKCFYLGRALKTVVKGVFYKGETIALSGWEHF